MLKAVLFDMDGLIFDTESIYRLSWQYAATEQNLTISDHFYQQFIGVQDSECERILCEHFGDALNLPRYKQVRDQHFHNLRDKGVALKPGFDELLSEIKRKQLACAIVTSSQLVDVKFNFSNSSYLSQFNLIITAEDVERGKPHPDCYQMAYSKLGVQATQCLVLEDSNNGIKAAISAGCHAIMVPDLLPPLPEIKEQVTIVNDLTQVAPLLDSF